VLLLVEGELDVLLLVEGELDVLELVEGELDVLDELDVLLLLLVEGELDVLLLVEDEVVELVEVVEVDVLDDVVVVDLPIILRWPLPINVKPALHIPSTATPKEMFVIMISPTYSTPGSAWKVAIAAGLPGW